MLPRWYVNYKYFVIGGWSKISLRNENENGTNLLLLIMNILLSDFINCYLALAIILMIMVTYTYSSLLDLFDPMAKKTPNVYLSNMILGVIFVPHAVPHLFKF